MQRQAQANLYHQNYAQIEGLLHHLQDPQARANYNNPQTGKPYTDAEIQQLELQREHAFGQYSKIAGIDKESKSALQKAQGIVDFIRGHRRAQMAQPPTPNYPTTVSDAGVSSQGSMVTPNYPTTVSDAGGNVGGGVSFDARRGGTLAPPPPAPSGLTPMQEAVRAGAQMPFATHGAKVEQVGQDVNTMQRVGVEGRQSLAKQLNLDESKPYVQDWILTGQINGRMISKFQKTNMVDPTTGLPVIFDPAGAGYMDTNGQEVTNPVPYEKGNIIAYTGPKGEPLFGIERYQKLYDQEGNQLPTGTKKFYPSLAEQDRWTINYKQVPQPDGRIALIPVLQRSGRTSPAGAPSESSATPGPASATGKQTGPSGPVSVTPQGAGSAPSSQAAPVPSNNRTPAKPKANPKVDAAAAMGLPKGSMIAGGKVPPGVAKAYETYNGSAERYQIMQNALAKVLESAKTGHLDQQAEINLLYNHIGMTTGLQKGARITQDIIHEAQKSAPWMTTLLEKIGIDNEFNITPTLLSGVTLTSETMRNMVDLARDRTEQDRAAWEREVQAARAGYGMGLTGGRMPPPPSTYTTGPPSTTAAKKKFTEF